MTCSQFERIVDVYYMLFIEEELQIFVVVAGLVFEGFWRLDELLDEMLLVVYLWVDCGYWLIGEDNLVNGWVWKCLIFGVDEGLLAGKWVGVKDNVCVAGALMFNGLLIMEGYVPCEDVTVVMWLLDVGAEIVGKIVVFVFCFDGGGLIGYLDL